VKDGTAPPARARRHLLRAGVVILVLAVIGGGVAWWLDRGRHLFFPKNWGVVEEGRIYRSGRIDGGIVEDTLRDHGIRVIVDLAASDPVDDDVLAEREAAKRLGIRKVDMLHLDGHGVGAVAEYVAALHEILKAREAEEPILVHCGGGSERTGGVFAIYRMVFQDWDGARAWDEYASYRMKPPDRPDLPDFVNGNLPEILDRLEALGVPVERPDPLPHFGPKQR
jgi:protein-tyrosine phosphatase